MSDHKKSIRLAVCASALVLSCVFDSTAKALPLACSAAASLNVPQDCTNLQDAIAAIQNGGTIVIANGSYPAPANGFVITNLQKGFTIRAAAGASVTLTGENNRGIFKFQNTALNQGGLVKFENLIFANGRGTVDGQGGGVTLYYAQASFVGCTFQNNFGAQPIGGGGGVVIALDSQVTFDNATFTGNAATNSGGAMAIGSGTTVSIVGSTFSGNRTNLPNHRNSATGGAIHLNEGNLTIVDTVFQNNESGYAGGAIAVLGDFATNKGANLAVSNSTFTGNKAQRDASVSFPVPTEGGAIILESLSAATISYSQFTSNEADTGGAISNYRGLLTISNSGFSKNRATGVGGGTGFGGAISAISSDTTVDGNNNWRAALVDISNSVISGDGTSSGQTGGGIHIGGDIYRQYGLGGVTQLGTVSDNRGVLLINNVIFSNLVAQGTSGVAVGGVGGAVTSDLGAVSIVNALFINNSAKGANSSGGAMAFLDQSDATLAGVTVAKNSSDMFGGGIFGQGSAIHVSNSNLVDNEVTPGVAEPVSSSFGAAIFTSPDTSRNLPVTGEVKDSVISNNIGVPIFDDDRTGGPINDVRYNHNTIFSTATGAAAYSDSVAGNCCKTVAQLNSLTINRTNGTSTPKSQVANIAATGAPVVAAIFAVPSIALPGSPVPLSLGYAWSGATSGRLDGNAVTDSAALLTTTGGTHTLVVGNATASASIVAVQPQAYMPFLAR